MSLSGNIKRLRLDKNLTQEQLATKLGVSAQAVSKWETSETYPDGALLVPLANELEVSLDELFGNETVTMADISERIVKLIHNTEAKERFNVALDLGGVPFEVVCDVVAYCEANKPTDTDWVVLPIANFDCYYGNTNFSKKWLSKIPADILSREVSNGVSRVKLNI